MDTQALSSTNFHFPVNPLTVKEFGRRLAQLRREKAVADHKDVDRRDVAKAVDASPSSVTRWENGEVFPGEDTMQALAAYFGVTPAWLRYGAGQRGAVAPIEAEEPVAEPAPLSREAARPKARRRGRQ